MIATLEIEYDELDDLRDIVRGLRNRESRLKRATLNNARLIAIVSLADAIEDHILNTKRQTEPSADEELKRAHKRDRLSKTVIFEKLSQGLYFSSEWGMSLDHEAVWTKGERRKWLLTWKESYMGIVDTGKRTKTFDTKKQAREFANDLAARSRR